MSAPADTTAPLLPGATLGVIGGGQLGRYFVLEARRLGYRTVVIDPAADAPAMQVAERTLVAAYDDSEALATLGDWCDAVTIEFENVPAHVLDTLAGQVRVAPAAHAVRIAQDRLSEKKAALDYGLTPVPHRCIERHDQIEAACEALSLPAILKTARLGYDGKGQQLCESVDEVRTAFERFGQITCVLETRIKLAAEVSVVLARSAHNPVVCFPVARNWHVHGILESSCVPADLPEPVLAAVREQATRLADGLVYEGVLAVEFFIDSAGQLFFNEMAPRPHNSGHYTLDATVTSQFEQQLRMLCGLPAGSVLQLHPAAMVNLLGDVWQGGQPDWFAALSCQAACLHLYGKQEERPGRKMGHITALADSAQAALALARKAQERLHKLG